MTARAKRMDELVPQKNEHEPNQLYRFLSEGKCSEHVPSFIDEDDGTCQSIPT